jgi:hypothetical protein
MVAATAPAPTGGTIVDGKYHLTNITLYTGPNGSAGPLSLSIKQTVNVKQGTVDVVEETNGKAPTRLTMTMTTTGSSVAMSRTCPSAMPGQSGTYSIKGNEYVWFLVNDVGQTVSYTYSP